MTAVSREQATLRDRYALPDWVVDSRFKRDLTLAVADAIARALARWPDFRGPTAQRDYARHVTDAVRDALEPHLAWLDDTVTDGFSYPGDVLVSYIAQLALTRPAETPDPDRYRELLRTYSRYLTEQADRYRTR